MQIWEPRRLREAFELALMTGEARCELEDSSNASNFRMALYRYRRRTGIGHDCTVECNGSTVVIRRIYRPSIEIIDEEGLLG